MAARESASEKLLRSIAAEIVTEQGFDSRWAAGGLDGDELDLNAAVGEEKGVVAYAAATVISDAAQSAQIRVSTPNSFKLWVNGEAIASYHVYHSGFERDHYTVPCRL